jgi:ADP-dependent phosphofructokinase/glucokinase
MSDKELDQRRMVIGGRHGSPSVRIAWPFSNIVNKDEELRDAVADLATLVARVASVGADEKELALVRTAAEELSTRLAQPK